MDTVVKTPTQVHRAAWTAVVVLAVAVVLSGLGAVLLDVDGGVAAGMFGLAAVALAAGIALAVHCHLLRSS